MDGVNGMLVFPDGWDSSLYTVNEPNLFQTGVFTVNTVSATDWAVLKAAGVVFLPASGLRIEDNVSFVSSVGSYWASTKQNDSAESLVFAPTQGGAIDNSGHSNWGLSVRLVQDCEE